MMTFPLRPSMTGLTRWCSTGLVLRRSVAGSGSTCASRFTLYFTAVLVGCPSGTYADSMWVLMQEAESQDAAEAASQDADGVASQDSDGEASQDAGNVIGRRRGSVAGSRRDSVTRRRRDSVTRRGRVSATGRVDGVTGRVVCVVGFLARALTRDESCCWEASSRSVA